MPDLRQALSSAVAKVAKYEKSIEQSQKIIAQVTADNLVFLTKFKDAEEKYRACDARREELQLMVDDQKGPWFDKIRSEIQKQVEGDRKTIHTLEAELTNAEQESRREIERLREEAEGLSRQNAELAEAKDAAEAKVRHHEGREKLREEREIKAAADFESLNQLLKDTLAENKVLRETINDERHSIADLTLESQDQKNAIEELRREVEAEREATKNAREALQKERWSLETQRRMNKELMSRKEEMEWKLMELTLGGPGADQAGAVVEGKADEKKKGGPGPGEGLGRGWSPLASRWPKRRRRWRSLPRTRTRPLRAISRTSSSSRRRRSQSRASQQRKTRVPQATRRRPARLLESGTTRRKSLCLLTSQSRTS